MHIIIFITSGVISHVTRRGYCKWSPSIDAIDRKLGICVCVCVRLLIGDEVMFDISNKLLETAAFECLDYLSFTPIVEDHISPKDPEKTGKEGGSIPSKPTSL